MHEEDNNSLTTNTPKQTLLVPHLNKILLRRSFRNFSTPSIYSCPIPSLSIHIYSNCIYPLKNQHIFTDRGKAKTQKNIHITWNNVSTLFKYTLATNKG